MLLAVGSTVSTAVADDGSKVDAFKPDLELARHDPRHVQQIVDELGLDLRVPLDRVERAVHDLGRQIALAQHVGPAQDGVERGPQLVRERGQEFVLHAVGIPQAGFVLFQGPFGALPVRDVDAVGLDLGGDALGIEPESTIGPQDPAFSSGHVESILNADLRLRGAQAFEHPPHARLVDFRDEAPEVHADQSVRRCSARPRVRIIHEQDRSVESEAADHLGLTLDDRAITLLAVSQAALRGLAFGDVREQDAEHQTAGVAEPEGVDIEPASAHRVGALLEAERFARHGNLAVELDPVRLEIGHQL